LSPDLVAKGVLLLICLTGGWLDARQRRLPNWLVLVTAVCGVAVAAFNSYPLEFAGHLAHAAIALVVGMVLFGMRIVGGVNAKYYAALALWFRLGEAWRMLAFVSLAGAVFFLAWFAWRRIRGKSISKIDEGDDGKFPYGVAIAAGAFAAYL
jgi:prepilin peptidase CpaA